MRVMLTNSVLKRDGVPAEDIQISEGLSKDLPAKPEHILLTGATGFLGIFLLDALLEKTDAIIYCLIRAHGSMAISERLKQVLEKTRLEKHIGNKRIVFVQGDLEAPRFGLKEDEYNSLSACIDTVYHNGALVNYVYTYNALKKANVTATEEILRFAVQKRLKKVHYMSTLFVFSALDYQTESVLFEHFEPGYGAELNMGYGQSKWVAEKMIKNAWARGIPGTIFRIGRISGDTRHGICLTNDFLWNFLKTCFLLKFRPELDFPINISPVDFVSSAIVAIASADDAMHKVYHINNPHSVSLADFFDIIDTLGYKLEKISFQAWKDKLAAHAQASGNPKLLIIIDILNNFNFENRNRSIDMTNTMEKLKNTSIVCPVIEKNLLGKYLKNEMAN